MGGRGGQTHHFLFYKIPNYGEVCIHIFETLGERRGREGGREREREKGVDSVLGENNSANSGYAR